MNKQFQDQIKKAQTNLESEIQTLNSQINKVPVASPKPGQ
jgi:peptidoglycan hydrolase CwlO-like protein